MICNFVRELVGYIVCVVKFVKVREFFIFVKIRKSRKNSYKTILHSINTLRILVYSYCHAYTNGNRGNLYLMKKDSLAVNELLK